MQSATCIAGCCGDPPCLASCSICSDFPACTTTMQACLDGCVGSRSCVLGCLNTYDDCVQSYLSAGSTVMCSDACNEKLFPDCASCEDVALGYSDDLLCLPFQMRWTAPPGAGEAVCD